MPLLRLQLSRETLAIPEMYRFLGNTIYLMTVVATTASCESERKSDDASSQADAGVRTASPPANSAGCEGLPEDHNILFKRGGELTDPYMNLVDRRGASSKERVQHLRAGIACLDRVLRITPGHWQSLWIRGKAYQALSEHEEARASFARAYTAQPDHPDVARELVVELLRIRRPAEAVRVARAISTKHLQNAGLRANLAVALVLNGDTGEAQEVVREALHLDPNDQITAALKARIDDVASGKRRAPKTLKEFEGGDG